jgi:hypothetical protein
MRDLNKTRYLLRSGNSVKRKTTPGQPNPGTPLSKNKASYKTLKAYRKLKTAEIPTLAVERSDES